MDDGKRWDALDVLFCCDSLPLDKVPQCTARGRNKNQSGSWEEGESEGEEGQQALEKVAVIWVLAKQGVSLIRWQVVL